MSIVESQPSSDVIEVGGVTLRPKDRINEFIYERPVGKGGMANVVLARSPSDEQVALKILKANRFTTGLKRFKSEWRALSRIRHPNVIRVDAYGDLHGHPYIVMEYVEGKDLHQTIRGFKYLENPDERWKICESILVDICRALAHVHQRGLVHRDLKPSNILIDRHGRAKLTDFGIVKNFAAPDPEVSRTLVGTWAYASPEQISGEPVDQRSDLYSLGIILFAMLTGCRPFDEKDMKGYLQAHRTKKAPRPRAYDRRIPKVLDEICQKLLAKDPKDRFQNAREVLYRLEQLEPDAQSMDFGEGWVPSLVGRAAETELLHDAVDRMTRREGGVIILEGREGLGRSRLLEVTASRAQGLGVPVHRLSGQRGPGGLFGLIEFCKQVLDALGERAPDELRAVVEDWTKGEARGGDAIYRLMDTLRPAVVQLLGDGPRIILYDDFHMLPRRGLEIFASLARTTVAIGEPALMVLAVRTEAVTPGLDAFLQGESMGIHPRRLRLAPLSLTAVTRLTEGLLGPGEKARVLAERLHLETQGNPLFVSQFLSALIQQGLLVKAGRGLELTADTEEIATGHLEIPHGVRQVVRKRLEGLSDGELEVLQLLAVSGRPLDLDLTLEVLDRDEDEVLDQLDALIGRGLVSERRTGELVYHDVGHRMVADVVYRDLDANLRKRLHGRLAVSLEQAFANAPAAIELVGDHYRLAGESEKAYRHLVAAAARMLARSLPSEAWELAVKAHSLEEHAAEALSPAEMRPLRLQLLDVRAEVLVVRAEWQEAEKLLETYVELAQAMGEPRLALSGRCRLAKNLRRLGEIERSHAEADSVLEDARAFGDRELVAKALYAKAVNAWDDGQPKEVERYASEGLVLTTGGPVVEVRGEMLLCLSIAQAGQGRMASASKGMEEAVDVFEALGVKPTRCLALCNLSEMLVWQGRLVDARARAEEAIELAQDISYRMGHAIGLRIHGEACMELGLFEQAHKSLTAALELSSTLRMTDEMIACRYTLARLAAEQRKAADTRDQVAIARGLAERSDPERYAPALIALNAWACAITGDEADARRMLERAERDLASLHVPRRAQVMIGAARAHHALGKLEDAERLAMQGTGLARSRGLRLLDLQGRLLLSEIAADIGATSSWREEAAALARAFDRELSPELAQSFRARPALAGLL
ncbi:MAG: protein kinase [Alphaproteobacteria bacterium]|nr:protein kinase [Alphaproteobacteria bacterium]MCB9792777.1 protein kinase [Alphaproteobacteria bacterium]